MGHRRCALPLERESHLSDCRCQPAAAADRPRRDRSRGVRGGVRNGRRVRDFAARLPERGDHPVETHAMTPAEEYAIETDALTRRFGAFVAVDRVTLKIPKGRLYGFLGLNGAGKTTTIRILTTLLPASTGTAKVWGHDVRQEPLAVRHLVGLVSDE